ncbi:hypothetical protein BDY21DRAFT_76171 [Lineolata rhizophorae]|uniref:RanBD1 domain-containing protein n=1 Tax=Lineolata rhizophorae TaxID=578093 RepID=A0A6A6NTB3_9PEZI|nr:hypothetical protein BDY21DRAFT_76171 [Lineolata rhizophorae]
MSPANSPKHNNPTPNSQMEKDKQKPTESISSPEGSHQSSETGTDQSNVRAQLKKATIEGKGDEAAQGNSPAAQKSDEDMTSPKSDENTMPRKHSIDDVEDAATPEEDEEKGASHSRKRSRSSEDFAEDEKKRSEEDRDRLRRKRSFEDVEDGNAGDAAPEAARPRKRSREAEDVAAEKAVNGQKPSGTPEPEKSSEEGSVGVTSPKNKRSRAEFLEGEVEPAEKKKAKAEEEKSDGPEEAKTEEKKETGEKKPAPQTSAAAFAASGFSKLSGSASPFSSLSGSASPFGALGGASAAPSKPSGFGGALGASSGFGSAFAGTSGFAALGKSGSGLSSFAGSSTGNPIKGPGDKPKSLGAEKAGEGSDEEEEEAEEKDAEEKEEAKKEKAKAAGPDELGKAEETKDDRFFEQEAVETGEEGEITIFTSRAKLYSFVTTPKKEWKERGVGHLRLNMPNNYGKSEESEEDEDAKKGIVEKLEEAEKAEKAEKAKEGEEGEESEKEGKASEDDDEEKDAGKGASKGPKNFPRLVMRADGSQRLALNSPIRKDLQFGDVSGAPPKGGNIVFMGNLPEGNGLELLQLKLRPENASALWKEVKNLHEMDA